MNNLLRLSTKMLGHYQTLEIRPRSLQRFSPDPGDVVIQRVWDTTVLFYPDMSWEKRVFLARMVDWEVGKHSNVSLTIRAASTAQQLSRITGTIIDYELRFPTFFGDEVKAEDVAHA